MKKTILWFLKAFLAGMISLGIVSGLCFFYYNYPTHYTNKTGATDYYLNENQMSVTGFEGFAKTYTDENGFVNTYPCTKDEIDILIMGSSHTESLNVNSDENYPYLLNKKLEETQQDKYAYSIGVSGHDFLRCIKNFDSAVNTYNPTECIVIETAHITFDEKQLEQLNNGTYDTLESYDSGLIAALQKLDFLRLAYSQVSNFIEKDKKTQEEPQALSAPSLSSSEDLTEYKKLLDSAIQRISKIAEKNNCKVIILYCPQTSIDYNGNIIKSDYTPKQELFKSVCEKYNVELVDMLLSYEEMYKEINYLPQGFFNTAVGKGHTNKYGHQCIAEKLYETIIEG